MYFNNRKGLPEHRKIVFLFLVFAFKLYVGEIFKDSSELKTSNLLQNGTVI
jgi:hypothetical protein